MAVRPHLFKTLAAAALAMGAPSAAKADVELSISPTGTLLGASNVPVGPMMLNVQFVGGPCTSVFTVCGPPGGAQILFLNSPDLAVQAANALLSEVGIGNFQAPTSPQNTTYVSHIAGCFGEVASSEELCRVKTPYAYNASPISVASVVAPQVAGDINADSIGSTVNSANSTTKYETWAVWTEQVTAVPEPASSAVLLAAATGLAGARIGRKSRRKARKQA